MKLYEYKCPKCEKQFEEIVKQEDDPVECPDCRVVAERVKLAMPKHGHHQSWRVS
jgi:putative FmdB family regulatory protein